MYHITICQQPADIEEAIAIGTKLGNAGLTNILVIDEKVVATNDPNLSTCNGVYPALIEFLYEDDTEIPDNVRINYEEYQFTIEEHRMFTTYQYVDFNALKSPGGTI